MANRKNYEKREEAAVKKHMQQLVGGKVVEVGCVRDSEGAWPLLAVEMPGGKVLQVQVSRDPEGNGPGHLFITEVPDEYVEVEACRASGQHLQSVDDDGYCNGCGEGHNEEEATH